MEAAVSTYQEALESEATAAIEYLRVRGIDHDTAQDFRLGYVGTGLPGYEHVIGRLAIPNICASGHVVGIKFRAIEDGDEPKYMKRAGDENRLFNLRALNEPTEILFTTEGEIDAITLTMLGVRGVVAIQGSESFKPYHWRLLEGYRKVIHFRDLDKAGQELAAKITATDLPVIVCEPPKGFKDVNEAFVDTDGRAALLHLIEEVSA